MSLSETLLLGFIAGSTIVFGLPVARVRRPMPSLRLMLNALAIGILIFLIWDVITHAWEPIDAALGAIHDHTGGLAPVFGYGSLFSLGLAVGLGSLVAYESWMGRSARRAATPVSRGPGAMSVVEGAAIRSAWTPARRLSLMIAVGIGLHNFAEGLAIGQSAASGELALATLLVIGFGLHNATEGFGIVAPLASADPPERERPTWAFLLLLGLIGGGPTFVGTVVGHGFTSDAVSTLFLMLAAGSILYVVIQLLGVAAKAKRPALLATGLVLGMLAGFATDAIVTAAGA